MANRFSHLVGDREIFLAAHLVIHQHGAKASAFTQGRIRFCRRARDRNSALAWTLVARAVKELLRAKPRAGEAIN